MNEEKTIHKISEWSYLLANNIKFYLKMSMILLLMIIPVYKTAKRKNLLNFLCKRTYKNIHYPKPILFFITNIILSIIIQITENTSGVLGNSISLNNILGIFGGITVGSIVSLIEYVAGAIIFSMLAKFFISQIANKAIKFDIIFNYVCYASTCFIPMLLIRRMYIDLGISWIENALFLYYFHTATYYLDMQTIVVILLGMILQILWIYFVSDGISCIGNRMKTFACIYISFVITSCTLPMIFTTYEIISKQRIVNSFKEIEEAKLNRNAEKILKNALLLIKNKRISPMMRYRMLLEYSATYAYVIAPNTYSQTIFELICENKYSALEGKFNEIFDNENRAWYYVMPKEAQEILTEIKTSESVDKEQLMLSRHRYDIINNFLLTPLDPSSLFNQFEYYPILNEVNSQIRNMLIQNDESLIQEIEKIQSSIDKTQKDIDKTQKDIDETIELIDKLNKHINNLEEVSANS